MDDLTPHDHRVRRALSHVRRPAAATARRCSRVVLVVAVMAGLSWGVSTVGAAPDSVTSAQRSLERATAARQQAERTVVERQARVDDLEAEAARLGEVDSALTQDLASARRQLREYAVAAYIDGGQSEVFRSSLSPEQASALAWQSNLSAGQSQSADEAAARFESLKATNTPARLAAAATLDDATRSLQEATFDAIQAAAFERDAEQALAAAQAAQAAAALRSLRRRRIRPSRYGLRSRVRTARPSSGGSTTSDASVADPAEDWGRIRRSGTRGDPTAAESATLARIRACESHGNYSIVSSSGRYRGAYQFDYSTWAAVGGSGDPAAASPAEQDYRALLLLRQRGTRPWPNCGR